MENCFLYDWLTVSFSGIDKETIINLLGMESVSWLDSDKGSRLKYGHRMVFDGISLHYTDDWDLRHNQGCCLEMSGQGCRDYETYGKGDWWLLFEFIRLSGGRVTRLDIAYDDFSGLIPIDIMAAMARRFFFTARSQRIQIIEEAADADPDHLGVTVCHGSRSSDTFIRCYDKRVEKQRYDLEHWVRLEIQLRNDNCKGFIQAVGSLGDKFSGVLANYVNYRCPSDDGNQSRWVIAPWWQKLLAGAAALSVHQVKGVEYNKTRLEEHIYERNHRAIKTCILSDGLAAFVARTFEKSEELPAKYQKVLSSSENADEILRILGEPAGVQTADVLSDASEFLNFYAMNV